MDEKQRYTPEISKSLAPIDLEDIEDYMESAYEEMEYDDYKRECKLREQENDRFLDEFEADLTASGLKRNTIDKHIDNVAFYLNTFLVREAPLDMRAGCYMVGDFLGNFFIRKCMWSTPNTIKSNAASFKKFYKSMLAHGHILQVDLDWLLCIIKDDLDYWCELCEEFDDPYSSNPFSPFDDDFGGWPFGMPSGLPFGHDEDTDGAGDADGSPDFLDSPNLLMAMREEAMRFIDELHRQGMTDRQILEAVIGVDAQMDLEEKLIESDDAQVMATLASTGIPANRPELEELMDRFEFNDEIVDELCKRYNVELDDENFDLAGAAVFALQVHWLPDE